MSQRQPTQGPPRPRPQFRQNTNPPGVGFPPSAGPSRAINHPGINNHPYPTRNLTGGAGAGAGPGPPRPAPQPQQSLNNFASSTGGLASRPTLNPSQTSLIHTPNSNNPSSSNLNINSNWQPAPDGFNNDEVAPLRPQVPPGAAVPGYPPSPSAGPGERLPPFAGAPGMGYGAPPPPGPPGGYGYGSALGPGGFAPPPGYGPGRPGMPPSIRADSEREWKRRVGAPKRGMTRRVKLHMGNFINEYPVPSAVRNSLEPKWKNYSERAAGEKGRNEAKEFTHMRYTAATCDPDDFIPANGWNLRQRMWGRETELLIAITVYNEDKILLARTLHHTMMNIRDIIKSNSKFWKSDVERGGKPSWQKIVVTLIFDGLGPCDKSCLDVLATLGVYQDNIMKKEIDGKETVAHLFEYTTQLSVDTTPALVVPQGDDPHNLVPVQMILCLKQNNSKKINSHRWLFQAMGRFLEPNVCILIDAGTKPSPKSLYYLWNAFHNNKHLGGACGEIHAMLKGGKKLFNPLVAAQNFEYKMSNILDKPLESTFGYVSVLPGAFSAYRYKALLGRPLQQYFHGDHTMAARLGKKGIEGMGIFKKNMFLAEDRILCFELVAKAGHKWTLAYVKPARGETDVPEGAAELISQRRRWLNGSFAASIYATVHFFRIFRSHHNILRLLFFVIQAAFNAFQLFFSWFAIANIWLTFSIIIDLVPKAGVFLFGTETITHWVNLSAKWLYLATLGLSFILALGNRPKGEKNTYILFFFIFAVLGYYLLVCAVILTVKSFSQIDFKSANTIWDKILVMLHGSNGVLIAALVSTYGIYLIASLLYADPWHMITSFPQYLGMAPSFTNILNVYAFCNLHDVSWGTKGSDKGDALPSLSSKKGKDSDGDEVEETEKLDEDLDTQFKETVQRAVSKYKPPEEQDKLNMDDSNRTFRTRLVSIWVLSNAALAVAIENVNGIDTTAKEQQDKQSMYFNVILWSTFGLSFVRFCGCFVYWLKRNLTRCCRKT